MASKGKTPNIRYENAKRTRTHEAVENTKHRVGRGETASVASHRSKSRVSDRSDRSRTYAKLGDSVHAGGNRVQPRDTAKKSGSIIVKPPGCPPPKSAEKQGCRPKTSDSVSNRTLDRERCVDKSPRRIPEKCIKPKDKWQNGVYCRDECGSGIISKKFEFKPSRQVWCCTPLTMYQATIGELGRQLLCREKVIARDVKPEPPCNVAEYILPPCRGYYRRYDCVRPCEEDFASFKQGRKYYRDRVERYWEPCETKEQKINVDINTFAHHNVFLGGKLRRKFDEAIPCW